MLGVWSRSKLFQTYSNKIFQNGHKTVIFPYSDFLCSHEASLLAKARCQRVIYAKYSTYLEIPYLKVENT